MIVRLAVSSDFDGIDACVASAFDKTAEAKLIRRLRADNDVLFEYVAELAGRVIGHVMVSELTLNPDPELQCGGIAPLSVLPAQQAAGVGSRLMEAVLAESRSIGLDALFLLGDPAYYQRFGFQVTEVTSDYPAAYFQAYEVNYGCLLNVTAKAHYAAAFSSLG